MESTEPNREAVIETAKKFISDKYSGYAYPDVPLDEDGNPERYEPGCVN